MRFKHDDEGPRCASVESERVSLLCRRTTQMRVKFSLSWIASISANQRKSAAEGFHAIDSQSRTCRCSADP